MAAIENADGQQAAELPGFGEYLRRRFSLRMSATSTKIGAATALWEWAAYGALLITASAMRLWDLGSRAVHHDESLHAYYSWKLASGDGFAHDPLMHGPLQFEATAAIFLLFGDSDYTSRLLYALAGVALVALPFLFRDRLGRLGALFTSVMLAFSPAMLYFSRFARNDILMAVWALGLVICMWRYMDEGKHRYIYIAAVLLALAFASKETAYLLTALLGLFLALLIIARNASAVVAAAQIRIGETTTVAAIGRLARAARARTTSFADVRGPAAFLLLLITLTLPLWSAAIGLFQETPLLSWSNLTFVAAEGGTGPIGSPSGGAILIAGLLVAALFVIAALAGMQWNYGVWVIAALAFYAVFVLTYSTFFSNLGGINTGMWQSLGYWIVQQDVARGNQPWYYYFVITPLYEFLPLALAIAAAVYYRVKRQGDAFTLFLFYWAGMTVVLFTIASEKMPWLLVNIALPIIVLAGKFLGDVASKFDWRSLASGEGLALRLGVVVGAPILALAAYRLALLGTGGDSVAPMLGIALAVAVAALIGGGVWAARRMGSARLWGYAAIPMVALLLVLTARAGVMAAYRNGDVPVEMLVYTQTSPDIPRLLAEIERPAAGSADGLQMRIDDTSGFTWPWAWYLRHSDRYRANFSPYDENETPTSPVMLIHSNNRDSADEMLAGQYTEAERVRHRWWFPEHTYRSVTPFRFIAGLFDREAWRSVADYWLFREGVRDLIGSEDAYVYFKSDFPQDFEPME